MPVFILLRSPIFNLMTTQTKIFSVCVSNAESDNLVLRLDVDRIACNDGFGTSLTSVSVFPFAVEHNHVLAKYCNLYIQLIPYTKDSF